jgi:hypothetical protein
MSNDSSNNLDKYSESGVVLDVGLNLDKNVQKILNLVGINCVHTSELDGMFIEREYLLSDAKYEEAKKIIPELKKSFSSSYMTCLQQNAKQCQKWPLLNLIRQIIHFYGYKMNPIRKSDGYTSDGVKKYKRYFQLEKKSHSAKNANETLNNESDKTEKEEV